MAKVSWQLVTERRDDPMPPAPMGYLGSYGLACDADGLLYVRSPYYHQFGELWRPSSDGAWHKLCESVTVSSKQPWSVVARRDRSGARCWSVANLDGYDSPFVPIALDVGDGEAVKVDLGDSPHLHRRSSVADAMALFADDPVHDRTLILDCKALHAHSEAGWAQLCSVEGQLPDEWHDEAMASMAVDPATGHVFVVLVSTDDYHGHVYRYDGEAFARIEGPTGVSIDGKNSLAIVVADADALWLVVGDGDAARYRWTGEGWEAAPAPGLPRSGRVAGAIDPSGALWLGPGFYEPVPGGYAKERKVFHVVEGSSVRRLGHWVSASPTEWYQGVCLAADDGVLWVASKRYPLGLRRVDADGSWRELVSEEEAKPIAASLGVQGTIEAALMHDGALHVVGGHGDVLRYDGSAWQLVSGPHADFKGREDVRVTSTPEGLVAWGGAVKNRKSNHTFRHDGSAWHKIKKASPKPSDFRHKHGPYVKWGLVYDPVQQAVLRMGYDDVSILVGDQWEAFVPDGYDEVTRYNAPRAVVDAGTGEVLLYDLWSNHLWRFGYDKVEPLGEASMGPGAIDPEESGTYAHVPKFVRSQLLTYDAPRRALVGLGDADAADHFELRLAEAFAEAQAMGPRAAYGGAPAAAAEEASSEVHPTALSTVRLYNVADGWKFWFADAEGAAVRVRSGSLWDWVDRLAKGTATDKSKAAASEQAAQASVAKQAKGKRGKNYVEASELGDEVFSELFATHVQVWELLDGEPGPHDTDQLGGVPGGIPASRWPKDRHGKPLGHLVSITAGHDARKAASISVFISPDDEAMEEGVTATVVRTFNHLAKARKAPKGAPEMPLQRLHFVDTDDLELHPRAEPFEQADPVFAARIEDYASGHVSGADHWTKVGGRPEWVQGPEVPHDDDGKPYRFVGQIDFGSEPWSSYVTEHWPDAAVFGTLFVFLSADEKQAEALWQYT